MTTHIILRNTLVIEYAAGGEMMPQLTKTNERDNETLLMLTPCGTHSNKIK
jgi:hypothetical protein